MSIQFVCVCGKHLRAREDMAGRRSMCPACGAPVGIPLLGPTHRGATLGPMSPEELRRAKRGVAAPSTVSLAVSPAPAAADPPPTPRLRPRPARGLEITFDGPIEPGLVRQVILREPARPKPARPSVQVLIYPLRASLPLLGLSVFLAAVTGIPLLLIPEIRDLAVTSPGPLLLSSLYLVVPFLALGYACAMLDGALAAGLAGDTRHLFWPGRDLGPALKSAMRWLISFLAGPILPIGAAYWYWLSCGDPELIDWLILADLAALAVGYGLFALLAVSVRDRLWDATPRRVAEQIERLGYRAPLAVLVATALLVSHGLWALFALDQIHAAGGWGWLLFAACWQSGLLLGTAFFRLLGNWCRRSPTAAGVPASAG